MCKKRFVELFDFIICRILKFISVTSWFKLLLFFVLQEVKQVSSFTMQFLQETSEYFTARKLHQEFTDGCKYSNKNLEVTRMSAC